MSKKYNIIIVILSAIILLVVPVIPHHHHEDVTCFTMELCENDNTYNDEHTSHPKTAESSESGTACIEESTYTDSNTGTNNNSSDYKLNPDLIISILLFNYNGLLCAEKQTRLYGDYIIFYTSAEIDRSNALRGPPSFKA